MDAIIHLALSKTLQPYIPEDTLRKGVIKEIGKILLIQDRPGRCNDPRRCGWTEDELNKLMEMEGCD